MYGHNLDPSLDKAIVKKKNFLRSGSLNTDSIFNNISIYCQYL